MASVASSEAEDQHHQVEDESSESKLLDLASAANGHENGTGGAATMEALEVTLSTATNHSNVTGQKKQ